MSGTRGWTFLALALSGLWLGCEQRGAGTSDPSASDREARSELLRDLVASHERAPDPEALRGPSGRAPGAEPPGQGGAGLPEPAGHVRGRVTWVGDNELLIRDEAGVERELEVKPATRLLMKGQQTGLRAIQEGDAVLASYDEGPGGLVARQVEVLLPGPSSGLMPDGGTRQEGQPPGARSPPPR